MRAPLTVFALALVSTPVFAQDTWTAPAPGVRMLVRQHHGVVLRVATADLANPELRPTVVALDGAEQDPARAAAEHDAFVGLAVSDGPSFVAAARTLLMQGEAAPSEAPMALGAAPLWGAVGLTATRGLVLLSAERERVPAPLAEETLRSLGVVRAMPVRGASGPALLLRGERLGRGAARAEGMLAVRWLPGASRAEGASPARVPVTVPPSAVVADRGEQVKVQAAGFTMPDSGPRGIAWLALSVLGCLGAVLGRRARSEE